jgi:hypothetical protein
MYAYQRISLLLLCLSLTSFAAPAAVHVGGDRILKEDTSDNQNAGGKGDNQAAVGLSAMEGNERMAHNSDDGNKEKATNKGTNAKEGSATSAPTNDVDDSNGNGNENSNGNGNGNDNGESEQQPQSAQDITSYPSDDSKQNPKTEAPSNDTIVSDATIPTVDDGTFPSKGEEQSTDSNSMFGGNLVEPLRSFSDYYQVPVASQEQSAPEVEPKSEETQPPQSADDKEQELRTLIVLIIDAGICVFLLAIGCFPDLRNKNVEQVKAKEMEFSFHGGKSECLTDADSSAVAPTNSNNSESEPYPESFRDLDSFMYDMRTITDACDETSDPWSFDENSECIEFGNAGFPTISRNPSLDLGDDDGSSISKRFSGIVIEAINLSKRHLLDRVARRNARYQEFDDSSQTSDPIPEDAEGGEFGPVSDNKRTDNRSQDNSQEEFSQLYAWAEGDTQEVTARRVRI